MRLMHTVTAIVLGLLAVGSFATRIAGATGAPEPLEGLNAQLEAALQVRNLTQQIHDKKDALREKKRALRKTHNTETRESLLAEIAELETQIRDLGAEVSRLQRAANLVSGRRTRVPPTAETGRVDSGEDPHAGPSADATPAPTARPAGM